MPLSRSLPHRTISGLGSRPRLDDCRRTSSLNSEVKSVLERHDSARWNRTLNYRSKAVLPFDPSQAPPDVPLLLDATVYVDQLKGDLPASIVNLVASRAILHGAPALAELAVTVGVLNPRDARTDDTLKPIVEMLERISPARIVVPSYDAWLEASVLAGILARTQGIPKADRRRFLSDALLFLMAAESRAVLISRNSRNLDLLLQMKPGIMVLLYEQT